MGLSYKETMSKNDRKSYKSSTINKPENNKIARLKGGQVSEIPIILAPRLELVIAYQVSDD